jgi:hypothetical protein
MAMMGVVAGAQEIALESLSVTMEVLAASAIALAVYVLVLRLTFPESFSDLIHALRRLVARGPAAPPGAERAADAQARTT